MIELGRSSKQPRRFPSRDVIESDRIEVAGRRKISASFVSSSRCSVRKLTAEIARGFAKPRCRLFAIIMQKESHFSNFILSTARIMLRNRSRLINAPSERFSFLSPRREELQTRNRTRLCVTRKAQFRKLVNESAVRFAMIRETETFNFAQQQQRRDNVT